MPKFITYLLLAATLLAMASQILGMVSKKSFPTAVPAIYYFNER